MRSRRRLLPVLLVVALLWPLVLVGCGTGPPKPTPSAVLLGRRDDGKKLTLSLNETIEVRLHGNPTTGYHWGLAKLEGDAVAQVGGMRYESDATRATRRMTGVGGTFIATFKAVKPGEADLTLEYRRAWEKDKPPLETFSIHLVVAAPTGR